MNKIMESIYKIDSGEGSCGTVEYVRLTDIGAKRRLTKERCGGDRWARASYKLTGCGNVYINIESGEASFGMCSPVV